MNPHWHTAGKCEARTEIQTGDALKQAYEKAENALQKAEGEEEHYFKAMLKVVRER